MKFRKTLTADELRERLHYDPETGIFRWRKTPRPGFVGKEAGYIDTHGYAIISIDFVAWKAHRLAFLYMTGEWPKETIDHRNMRKSDNRWSNLRDATAAQNQANNPKYSCNTSGAKGVFVRPNGRYRAAIRKNYKLFHIGTFATLAEASAAYAVAHAEAFGEFSQT